MGWCRGIIACPATAADIAIARASKGQVMMPWQHCPPCCHQRAQAFVLPLPPLLPLQGKEKGQPQPRWSSPQQWQCCHCVVTTAAVLLPQQPCRLCRRVVATAATMLPLRCCHSSRVPATAAALPSLRCCHSSPNAAVASSSPQQHVAATAAASLQLLVAIAV